MYLNSFLFNGSKFDHHLQSIRYLFFILKLTDKKKTIKSLICMKNIKFFQLISPILDGKQLFLLTGSVLNQQNMYVSTRNVLFGILFRNLIDFYVM